MGRASRRKRERAVPVEIIARVLLCPPKDLTEMHRTLREDGVPEDEWPRAYPGSVEDVCRCGIAIMVGPRMQQARSEFDLTDLPYLTLCPGCAAEETKRQADEMEAQGRGLPQIQVQRMGASHEPIVVDDRCPTCEKKGVIRERGMPVVRECEDCGMVRSMMWARQLGVDVATLVVGGPIPGGPQRNACTVDRVCERCGTGVFIHPPIVKVLAENPLLRLICYSCMGVLVPDHRVTEIVDVTDL